jgi:hypothetical protein
MHAANDQTIGGVKHKGHVNNHRVAQHIKLGPRALARALPLCNVRVVAKARAREMHRHQP